MSVLFRRGDFWEDPSVYLVGAQPSRATLWPFSHESDARKPNAVFGTDSDRRYNLNGVWKFRYFSNAYDVPEDFFATEQDLSFWDDQPVPGCWQMDREKNYDIPHYMGNSYMYQLDPPFVGNSPVGIYRRTFSVAALSNARRYFLNFDGGGSCLDIWLNGKQVGISKGSHLPSEFEVTDLLRTGENVLTVRVFKLSDGTYLESQDHIFLSGLFRNVYLLERNESFIRDVFVHACFRTKTLTAEISCTGSDGSLRAVLTDTSGNTLAETEAVSRRGALRFSLSVPDAKPWNAEMPVLYRLLLFFGGEVIPVTVGFRDVEILDGVFCINETPVKFKGVNRHDMNPDTGYFVPLEEMEHEIHLMKQCGVNAVRTSHYPNAPAFYELCSRYGIYVLDETDLETHGMMFGQDPNLLTDDPQWSGAYLDRMERMVERDKNHPCVVIWSLGNESFMGKNHLSMAHWTKERDPDRPVHYEPFDTRELDESGEPADCFDIIPRMYPSPQELFEQKQYARKKRPVFMCEYAHALGLGPGGLEDYWDVIYSDPRFMGGCIWEWRDLSVREKTPDGKEVFMYGGHYGEEPNDLQVNTDGILFPDLQPKTAWHELKKAIQPIRFSLNGEDFSRLALTNTQDFSDLSPYCLRWILLRDGYEVASGTAAIPPCAPGETVTVSTGCIVPDIPGEYALNAEARILSATPWAGEGHLAAWAQFVLDRSVPPLNVPQNEAKCTVENGFVTFEGEDFRYIFHVPTGHFCSLQKNGQEYLSEKSRLTVWRAPIDNDLLRCREEEPVVRWRKDWLDRAFEKTDLVTLDGSTLTTESTLGGKNMEPAVHCRTEWRVLADGSILATLHAKVRDNIRDLPRFGIEFFLPESFDSVEYYGLGPGQNYRDMRASAKLGIWSSAVDDLRMPYIKPQENGARMDIRWLRLKSGERQLTVRSLGDHRFMFSAGRNTAEETEAARSYPQLIPRAETVLRLDYAQNGVGSAACGPVLPEKHAFKEKEFTYSFELNLQ